MGYSTSKETIDRVRDLLDVVLLVENEIVSIPTKNPRRLAYAVRDALNSCKQYESEKKYLVIQDRFKIKQGEGKVLFEPREYPRDKIEKGTPIANLRESYSNNSEISLSGLSSALEVIGACIEHKAHSMIFPDAKLQPLELTKAAGWCSRNNYHISNNAPLTITKNEPSQTK